MSSRQHYGPPYQHYFELPIVYSVGLLGRAQPRKKEREKERRERGKREERERRTYHICENCKTTFDTVIFYLVILSWYRLMLHQRVQESGPLLPVQLRYKGGAQGTAPFRFPPNVKDRNCEDIYRKKTLDMYIGSLIIRCKTS